MLDYQSLINWNETTKDYSFGKTIQELFENQVEKTPDNSAIVFGGESLTYKELNNKANQLAHYIKRQYNITPDTLIALCLERNSHLLIGILAILKAGGAYVPIDSSYPDERIQYILEDTNTKLILTNAKQKLRLEEISKSKIKNVININGKKSKKETIANNHDMLVQVLAIEENDALKKLLDQEPTFNLELQSKTRDLAYVIYTSGSTGQPKGVMIEHAPYVLVVNSIRDLYFSDRENLSTCSFTNYVFDIFGLEYGLSLFTGGTLYFENISDNNILDCSKYDFVQMTPSLCEIKLELLVNTSNIRLLIGGESLSHNLLTRILSKSITIINVYGPTETTIWSTSKLYIKEDLSNLLVSIGKPLFNEKTYVLNDDFQLAPIGTTGELYIGGDGLARGYLNRPQLTNEKFLSNPFQTEEEKRSKLFGENGRNARLYKTGDLVKRLDNGDLEFIGRNDFQVKIRGHRVELGEIERTLSILGSIKQSVVVSKESKSSAATEIKYLVAYYVSEKEEDEKELIKFIQKKLPDYMIPSVFMWLPKLPLTLNGKLDLKALPEPKFKNIAEYIAPRNDIEKDVCKIWSQLLDIPSDHIGINDSFFRLGGNSILAIKLIAKINKDLNKNLNVSTLFKHNTIQQLSSYIEYNDGENIVIDQIIAEPDEYSLSFAQERLLFIEKYAQGTKAYNEPMIFKLGENIQLDILEKSILNVVGRHETLRTIIKENQDGNGYQFVLNLDDAENALHLKRYTGCNQIQLRQILENEHHYAFDLSREYPIRINLCEFKNVDKKVCYYLCIVIHHMAFDGWSMDVFLRDLKEYYRYYLQLSNGFECSLALPELTIQYKDFSLWQRNYLKGNILNNQLNYWKNKLADYETLNIPTDRPRPNQFDYKGKNVSFILEEELSISLRQLAQELEVSLYTVLISGFLLMLKAYTNQSDIVIGTPVANRHYNQIENLIGFFVNTLVLKVEINSTLCIDEFIKKVGYSVIEAQLHQDLPFEKLVDELDVKKDPSRNPIFQVMFGVDSFGRKQNNVIDDRVSCVDNLFQLCMVGEFCQSARFDLDVFIDDSGSCLNGFFNYAVALFEETTVKGFIETYKHILGQLSLLVGNQQITKKLFDISYLDENVYLNTIKKWNTTEKIYSNTITVHGLFEEQVISSANEIAVYYENESLSYQQLNEYSNQLAHFILHKYPIKPDTLVLLFLDRSELLLLSIFGILKTGGAYVPIDISYPSERIKYIIEDTRAILILTNEHHRKKIEQIIKENSMNFINQVVIDEVFIRKEIANQPTCNLNIHVDGNSLAYVLYTSGTTGKPKGVMIEHKSVVNYIQNIKSRSMINFEDRVDFSTSIGFDLSVTTSIGSLCLGAKVVVYGHSLQELNQYKEHLIANKINVIKLVPSYFDLIIDVLGRSHINKVILGGEKLTSSIVKKVIEQELNQYISSRITLFDEYGPTENTVGTCINKINSFESLSIGRFYDNHIGFILDDSLRLLPIGAIGELYVGGQGVARGYLNKPELTKEKFIKNPFLNKEEREKGDYKYLYKTGDLVRWRVDGNLEYIGRNDFQVKLRGYRIEPEEIEKVISSFPKVNKSVVLVREREGVSGDNKYLIAYYVADMAADQDDDSRYVKTWEDLYQEQYSTLDIEKFKQNYSGWTSSYTGEAINNEDMAEWVASTVNRIKELKPRIILEIGSGSGLILFNLLDEVEHYLATDLSENAIMHATKVVEKLGKKEKVSLFSTPADSISYNNLGKYYDTVIINSVAQYFPSLDYLDSVINQTIQNISGTGKVFVGDLRDYRLFECFHYSVQKLKKGIVTKADIEYFSKRDKELLVSPEYFVNLKKKNNLISQVEIMPKLGEADHEMNNYRYDVVLYIGHKVSPDAMSINEDDFCETADIIKNIEEGFDADFLLVKYKNKRIINDLVEYKQISSMGYLHSKEDNCCNILSINEIITKACNKGYQSKFYINSDPLYINVILYRNRSNQKYNFFINYNIKNQIANYSYSNNPLVASKIMTNNLTREIKTYLSSKVPSYMMPEYFVQLEELPLTINGKIDRKALPDPEFVKLEHYVSPRDEIEAKICCIWAEVLGLDADKVGIYDDFFRLGGNSILAIRLISKLNKELNKKLRVACLFKDSTVIKLISSMQEESDVEINIQKIQVEDPRQQKLSFAQERLWFIEKYEQGTYAYNIPMVFEVACGTNLEALNFGLKRIVVKHEVLRTLIKEEDGNAYQDVLDAAKHPLEIFTIDVKNRLELDIFIQKEINHIFDFTDEYPIRVKIYNLAENNKEHKFLSIVIHHIAFDGWSTVIFLKELQEFYNHYLKNNGKSTLDFPEMSIQYKDFSLWQRQFISGDKLENQLTYWRNKLAGFETLNLITDFTRPLEVDYKGADIFFEIDENLTTYLKKLAQDFKVSLFSLLLSAFYLMLRIYSNQSDIVIGTPIANRHYSKIENLIGLFVNTLVLRTNISGSELIKDYIERVGNEIKEALAYQDLPFEKIVEDLKIEKDASRNPIFQVMFGLENFRYIIDVNSGLQETRNLQGLLKSYKGNTRNEIAQFDLSTFIDDQGTKLIGIFNYAESLFTKETVVGYIETYVHILKQFSLLAKDKSSGDYLLIEDINYLNQVRYHEVIELWNETRRDLPKINLMHELFEEQVEKTPYQIAVTHDKNQLTYHLLNKRANQLARYLELKGLTIEDPVVVLMKRGVELLTALLAILKFGGVYIPLDPKAPAARNINICQQCKPKIILCDSHYEWLDDCDKNVFLNINDLESKLKNQDSSNLCRKISSLNLAYIIFTSGSTGLPKGVMINHQGMINHIFYKINDLGIDSSDVVAQTATQIFDISIWQLLTSLVIGAKVVIYSDEIIIEPKKFLEVLKSDEITILELVPSYANTLALFMQQEGELDFRQLKHLIITGEKLRKDICEQIFSVDESVSIINAYGPTECSDDVTHYQYRSRDLDNSHFAVIPLGKVGHNLQAYIVNDQLEPVPVGALGELCISGIGLGRGYYNKPSLTAKQFIANPFYQKGKHDIDSTRMYRTGDLCRATKDGNFEFIGRIDDQIKLRGYRIELGEIEKVLTSFDGISQSVAEIKDNKNSPRIKDEKYLVGYYVSNENISEKLLDTYLKSKLPDYMVPTYLIHLLELPLTINGKINRKALPSPKLEENNENYIAPRNALEKKVAKIWSDLLGISEDKVGIQDDFFRLGGNSLHAIRLISKMNKDLKTNLGVATIFKNSTIEKLSSFFKETTEDNNVKKICVVNPKEQKLSFAQERLWFIEKYEEGTNAYNVPMIYELLADTNMEALEKSLKKIVDRQEILRTVIKEEGQDTYQLVLDSISNPLVIVKSSVKSIVELEDKLKTNINIIFDLTKRLPIHVYIYELYDEKGTLKTKYLCIVIHHIAFDGWSTDIFLNELQEYYAHHLNSDLTGEPNLPKLNVQYKDFSLWQRNYLTGEKLEFQLNYWKEKLNGYEILNLTTDFSRPQLFDYKGMDIFFEIDEGISIKLRQLAKELKVSLYSLLLSAFYLMLRSYSNQDDIVIGTPVANRHYGEVENILGLFINSLALRMKINGQEKIKDYIGRVGNEVKEGQVYQDLPFEKLIEELKVEKDTSRHPVFQVMFRLESFGSNFGIKNQNGRLKSNLEELLIPYKGSVLYRIAKFDLNLCIDDENTKLIGVFNYAESLYKQETIEGFIDTYLQIVQQISELDNNRNKQELAIINDINYLSEKHHELVIKKWNQTNIVYQDNETIHSLFEKQVNQTPNNVAIVFENKSLTYKELNERSNQLGHYLRKLGVGPETLIAILIERSLEMIIGLLGIIKAGGAYVPLDANYPMNRLQYILEDTKAPIIITDDATIDKIPATFAQVISLDEIWKTINKCPSENLKPLSSQDNLAYIIYTSGTTGMPKGVMIEQAGVINLAINQEKEWELSESQRFRTTLWYSNFVFDAHVWEFYSSILNGHTIHLMNEETRQDTKLISNYIKENKIDIALIPPVILDEDNLFDLKILVVGGDKSNKKIIQKYLNREVKVINAYGPTEITVMSNSHVFTKEDGPTNIGTPISNTNVYVLDKNLKPVPIGAVGELYLCGVGIARGYLNQSELTAQKFVANPFQTDDSRKENKKTKLYKTGDLVRWKADGKMEYVGRNDFQVKIRGYRIELEEIEKILSNYEGIKQCVVVAKDQKCLSDFNKENNKYLAAYYMADNRLNEEQILSHLSSKLPEYMIPNQLVYLQQFPLTTNGKIDRKLLPDPNFTIEENYLAPRNEIEKQLSVIWAEVLGLSQDKIGIQDDFFRLGGDSIISIQLVSRLRQRLNLRISVKDIFTYKTIERLYEHVLSKISEQHEIKTEQGILSGDIPLLPIQQWFFDSNFELPSHWNQAFIIKVSNLDITKLQKCIESLVVYHDAFRIRFKNQKNSSPIQYYDDDSHIPELKILNVQTLNLADTKELESVLCEKFTQWQSEFDLENGPLYSIAYLYGYEDGTARIFFALHHLIVDSVSWRILAEDLRTLYSGGRLDQKGSSYRQWVDAVRKYGENNVEEKNYWFNVLSDFKTENEIVSYDFNSESNNSQISLSKEFTAKLLGNSNLTYHTEINDLLLTALALALYRFTGNSIHHIVLEGHGREEIDPAVDITGTLGWFTTMYPVRLEINDDLGESIKSIKETLRSIPNKGIGYGIIIGYKEKLPGISFNYHGQFDTEDTLDLNIANGKIIWKIVGEDTGESISNKNHDFNVISLNGLVLDGRLQFDVSTKFDIEKTKLFAKFYKESAEEVINYTISRNRTFLTVSDVNKIINQEYLNRIQEESEVKAVYKANSLQQGFIYHSLNQGAFDDAYRVQFICEYESEINSSEFKTAWECAQRKYSCLRMRFAWEEELVQIIDKKVPLNWEFIDISELKEDEKVIRMQHIQAEDRKCAYNLGECNLFRILLIKQKKDLFTCIFSSHHAILDGWSHPILLKYVHETYLKIHNKQEIEELSDDAYELSQKYIQDHENDNHEYWDKYISKVDERADLTGLLKQEMQFVNLREYRYIKETKEQQFYLENKEYKNLKELSQKEGLTLNAILLYVWHKALSVYGNTKQTVVGITVSGRSLPINKIENSVGLHINTLPLIVDHQNSEMANVTILDSIKAIQENVNEINISANINLARLQRDGERFDSLFVYENYPDPANEEIEEVLKVKVKDVIEEIDYPLGAVGYDHAERITFKVTYAGELFDEKAIERLLSTVKLLLTQITTHIYQSTEKLDYLNSEEYQKIIHDWNKTEKEYPHNKTIQVLFEEQVAKMPDSIAVFYEGRELTYGELNSKANQLAHYIKDNYRIKSNSPVVLLVDRSELMIITILAILKAGGAYVPIDSNYPDERIGYILQSTKTNLIIANEGYVERLNNCLQQSSKVDLHILAIDDQEAQTVIKHKSKENVKSEIRPTDLAYIIYTSGTTGQPKGVAITHRNLVASTWARSFYYPSCILRIGIFSLISFDITTGLIFWGLTQGGTLFCSIKDILERPIDIIKYIEINDISHITFVPSVYNLLLQQKTFSELSSCLQLVFLGGEVCSKDLVTKHYQTIPNVDLYNEYGPTENTVWTTVAKIVDAACSAGEERVSIGKPIANSKYYVLNKYLKPVPIGAIAELYISGDNLANGYFSDSLLNEEKFILNPFQTLEDKNNPSFGDKGRNASMYKTGDLVRLCADGNLDYISRNDFQVKIRGYRIELGEIETAILKFEGVNQSAVTVKERKLNSGEVKKYLVGYYVSEKPLDEEMIMALLDKILPDYMVPEALMHLEHLPITINGKLDVKVLPNPPSMESSNYFAPRNDLEHRISEVWSEVLGLMKDKIGIRDNFFKLGGDSIVSIQLVSRLRQRLNIKVSIKDIFTFKTIERLYDNVLSKTSNEIEIKAEQGNLKGQIPLLSIQEWFFESNFKNPFHWNQSFIIRTPELEIKILQDSILKLIKHHDAFRIKFKKQKDSSYIQYYDDQPQVQELKILNIKTLGNENSEEFESKLNTLLTDWQSNFNFESGPLYSIAYLYGYEDGSARIYFALHHLIVDTVSWRILTEHLRIIYSGGSLTQKTSSYRQWAETVNAYANSHLNEKSFWLNVLSDYEVSDIFDGLEIQMNSNSQGFKLNHQETKRLLEDCNQAYNTQIIDLLLTALGLAISKLYLPSVHHIILESHGREEIDKNIDITETIGWFTTMYPVRLETRKEVSESIKYIKMALRQIPHNGIGYGPLVGYRTKIPKISFNYLGQFEGDKEGFELDQASDFWKITAESSGTSINNDNQDNNLISLNGFVMNGCMSFDVSTRFKKEETMRFAEIFKETLDEIIAHCSALKGSEETPDDFPDFEPYILFNSHKNENVIVHKNKLFLFSPGGGGAESYFGNIIPNLKDMDLIAFNNYYDFLIDRGVNYVENVSYEKLAGYYIAYMKAIQAEGPYNLCGWSSGGVLAFEIARQLFNNGDKINNIFIIDSFFNYKKALIETSIKREKFDAIHFNYCPKPINLEKANIVLFKALRSTNSILVSRYYVEKTKYNHLESVLKNLSSLNVVPIASDHLDWTKNENEILKMTKVILTNCTQTKKRKHKVLEPHV